MYYTKLGKIARKLSKGEETMTVKEKEILYIENKHIRYFTASDGSPHDMNLRKDVIHYTDGTSEPVLNPVYDYERPFYITKPAFRNHKEKKEWEDVNKLRKYMSTQIDLVKNIQRALGRTPGPRDRYPYVARSPYLYGSDIASNCYMKFMADRSMESKGYSKNPFSVAVLDLETDVTRDTGEILTGAVITTDHAYCYYTEAFKADMHNIGKGLEERCRELIDEKLKEQKLHQFDGITYVFAEVKKPVDVSIECLARLHEIKPDLVTAWNMKFDIGKLKESFENAGIDPADHFCDPSIPNKFKQFNFKEAALIKTAASGRSMAKHMADLWHVVDAPASFYWIDAMCAYKILRVAKGMESSYALDFILNRNKLGGKLKFDKADGLTSLDRHKVMQSQYKREYIAYNIYDCLSVAALDNKNNDLALTFMLLIGHSDMGKFTSTPRRLADDAEFIAMENGKVAGSTSDDMETDLDKEVFPLSGWIVTLPAHHMDRRVGINIYGEGGEAINTAIVTHSYDSDVVSAYPETEISLNISKETTMAELCGIGKLGLAEVRRIVLSFTSAHVNASEICQRAYNVPCSKELDELFRAEFNVGGEHQIELKT